MRALSKRFKLARLRFWKGCITAVEASGHPKITCQACWFCRLSPPSFLLKQPWRANVLFIPGHGRGKHHRNQGPPCVHLKTLGCLLTAAVLVCTLPWKWTQTHLNKQAQDWTVRKKGLWNDAQTLLHMFTHYSHAWRMCAISDGKELSSTSIHSQVTFLLKAFKNSKLRWLLNTRPPTSFW